eukprot:6029086-Pyramimonas_sp.AAC.1
MVNSTGTVSSCDDRVRSEFEGSGVRRVQRADSREHRFDFKWGGLDLIGGGFRLCHAPASSPRDDCVTHQRLFFHTA